MISWMEYGDVATESPWISFVEGRDHTSGESVIVRGVNVSKSDLYLTGATVADQDFIAHTRQDVTLLLDGVNRLHKLVKKLHKV